MYQQQYQQGGYAPQNQGGYAPQNQNVYVGSAKFQQGQYGLMVSISLNAEDIAKLQANLNQNGWVTFSLRERQQPSQSGATHYGVIRPPMDNQGGGYQQGYQQPRPPQNYQPRPQQGYQQRPQGANWNGPVGPSSAMATEGKQYGQRGNQWNGARGQGYQQPAPPPQQAAPAQHRYTPADAQPPAADDGQEPPIENDMPM